MAAHSLDAGRWTLDGDRDSGRWTLSGFDHRPESNLLWFVTTVQTKVTESSNFQRQRKRRKTKTKTKKQLGRQSSMRRMTAARRLTGVMMAMIVGCLLAGAVTGAPVILPTALRPKARTPRPSATAAPTVIDFESTVMYDYGSGSQDTTSSTASQPEAFAAGTVRPELSEPTPSIDISTSSPPTSKPPKHIYFDATKPPTPAPTPLGTTSAKTQSPSTSTSPPPSATPASTTRLTTKPTVALVSTQPIIRTPVVPATSPTPTPTPTSTSKPPAAPAATTSAPPSSSPPPVASNPPTTEDVPEDMPVTSAVPTPPSGTSEGGSLRTAAPESATPQAISGSKMTTAKSKWSLMIIVGSIATVAVVAALLIWRDTRRIRRRTCVSETLPAQSKNTSCELDFDWYPPSPSLTSAHQSVNTFMGRMPGRKESEAHVSSRAASTADLLNVSSIGDRSTRSDPSSRSEPIYEHQDEDSNSSDDKSSAPVSRSDRTNSSPPVSFDDEVNVLSDWEGSDYDQSRANSACSDIGTDASVEMIFNQHRKAYLQARGEGSPRDRASNFLATWTSSLPRSYTMSALDNNTCPSTESCTDFKFEEDESKSDEERDSNGSAYSAVPSCAVILEDYSIMMTSFHSDWSGLTGASGGEDGNRASDRSIGTYDEEL